MRYRRCIIITYLYTRSAYHRYAAATATIGGMTPITRPPRVHIVVIIIIHTVHADYGVVGILCSAYPSYVRYVVVVVIIIIIIAVFAGMEIDNDYNNARVRVFFT